MGVSFLGLLFIVLLVLKLTGLAAISWLVVFLPLIVTGGLVVSVLLLAVIAHCLPD